MESPPRNCDWYEPQNVTSANPRTHSRVNGVKLMRSEKWCSDAGVFKKRLRGIPFVMESGHLSGSCKLTWKCPSSVWFSTTVRAVYEKLRKRCVLKKQKRRKSDLSVLRIALFYVLTNDEYSVERLVCCQTRGFNGLFSYLLARVDAATKCCMDQALKCANWFLLRGKPRVQSTVYCHDFVSWEVHAPPTARRLIRTKLNDICDPWVVGIGGFTKGIQVLTNRGSLGAWIY